MSALQPLQLDNVDPHQQWSLFPFGSATFDRVDDDIAYRTGFDVFWRPSTNVQLTGTLNPDFGTVETDDVTINLTADETFFPEKRLFFLEGQEIFSTTPRANDPVRTPFVIINTRRIGGRPNDPDLPPDVALSPREGLRLADLDGAAKLTGQLGRFRYGTLAAFEDSTGFRAGEQVFTQSGRDFGAVRLIYEDDIGASYRGLGLISTLVSHSGGDALVNGMDFHYLSTGGRWNIDGLLLHSNLDSVGNGKGGLIDIAYTQRQGLRHSIALTAFDNALDVNDFGFQRRNDIREVFYKTTWVKSSLSRIRDFVIEPSFTYEVNGNGRRTEVKLDTDFQITLNNLHDLNLYAAYLPESFDDRNSFGNGTFRTEERYRLFAQYSADTGNPVSYFAGSSFDTELLGGHKVGAFAGGTWRPSRNISVELSTRYLDYDGWLLHQQGRDFTTFQAKQWTHELNFEYFPAAKQHFQIALQWVGIRAIESEFFQLPTQSTDLVPVAKPPGPRDDFSLSQLNFQIRYRWQIAPLSDLFVVYTKADNRQTVLSTFGDLFSSSWSNPLGDQLVIKIRYRLGSM